jgi:hypothetical protein
MRWNGRKIAHRTTPRHAGFHIQSERPPENWGQILRKMEHMEEHGELKIDLRGRSAALRWLPRDTGERWSPIIRVGDDVASLVEEAYSFFVGMVPGNASDIHPHVKNFAD